MVLRFKEESNNPRYVAFNTRLGTYTTDPAQVKQGQVITIACNHFDHIIGEIRFNGYDYSGDLSPIPEEERDMPF